MSVVHAFPSSTTGGAPATHDPAALHVSNPLQASSSEQDVPGVTAIPDVQHFDVTATPVAQHPFVSAECVTIPVEVLQESAVQGLPSSTVFSVPTHTADALQTSLSVHALLSLQLDPVAATCVTAPVAVLHPSVVHAFPSSTTFAVPTHCPDALHKSFSVQAFASLHACPVSAACVTTPVEVLQESAVQGLLSSTVFSVPTHAADALQTSLSVQALLSLQLDPVAAMCETTPVAGSQRSFVHAFPSSTAFAVPTHCPDALHALTCPPTLDG
ncbi:hypothetical protein [Anaeromyxobacter sp. SG26]|uniref:hypothetical protein n=1 Tax=Anaeromyxobacter sp. SG26 TaxID=2925407 RepID=UPI001F5AF27C|nr:hypothetical protein [Anaeromyxobacter sp. SG26]